MKFYSEVTKKLYESEEDLRNAEIEVAAEKAKKEEAALAKKADATKVEEAFKANNAAKREYNTKVVAARKMYNEAITNAKKAFDEAVSDAAKVKDTAEKAYDEILKDFIAKHPEGYHLTLKDGDNVVTLSSQTDTMASVMRDYSKLLDCILNLW